MARAEKKEKLKKKNNMRSDRSVRAKSKHATDKNGLLSDVGGIFAGFDYVTLALVLLLTAFGVIMVFSASYYTTVNLSDDALFYLKRQMFFALTGLVVLVFFANFDYHRYYKLGNLLMVTSITLLVLVLLVGINVNGATRWLGFGSFRITPSEFSKLFMIIWTSVFLASDPDNICTQKGLLLLFGVMIVHFGLIFKQPNLSTAIVIAAIMVAIMIVAGLNLWWIGGFAGLGALGGFVILNFMKDTHWYSRLTNWMDPFADSQGEGYQVSQSIIALGNGGIKGLGFGNSVSKNLYLPEPQNDFILAVIGEELGFIGFVILMIVYVFLLYRLILIALKAKDRLGFYLATGVAVLLGLQVIINIAVVTASMPATGITLPFISYGGTSLWVFMAAIGISLNVSRYGKGKKADR
ncbi:MAG: putative lipid II flippase FtsW [Mogibacterium sp.]|nr:putative lipid II flippase FtsW [Mogibacterium sp.]